MSEHLFGNDNNMHRVIILQQDSQ